MNDRIWLTWEHHRRSVELAQALGIDLFTVEVTASRSIRYPVSIVRTVLILLRERPRIIFSPSPSLILIATLAILRPLLGFRIVCDLHNAGVDYVFDTRAALRSLARWSYRQVALAVVTNEELKKLIRPFVSDVAVLPDKLPMLLPSALPTTLQAFPRPYLVLVSTFAYDEPIEEVLKAFGQTAGSSTLFVTGKREKAGELLRYESQRIHFTGFLSQPEYDALISNADLVIDLSTLANCLVCGAYEALAAGVPTLLSESAAGREVFGPGGARFSCNTVDALTAALSQAVESLEDLKGKQVRYQTQFADAWHQRFVSLQNQLWK